MRNGLIVGVDSLIGDYLNEYFRKQEFKIFSTSRKENKIDNSTLFLDLNEAQNFKPNLEFDFAIVCAGITSVSQCETQQETAYNANVKGTIELIDYLINQNCQIVFLSSNLVF